MAGDDKLGTGAKGRRLEVSRREAEDRCEGWATLDSNQ